MLHRLPPRAVICPLLLATSLLGCGGEQAKSTAESEPRTPTASSLPPWLEEQTVARGLPAAAPRLPHDAPASDGSYQLREIMGPGIGLADVDGDGRLDILEPRCPSPDAWAEPSPNRLWLQGADGMFADATSPSGLGDPGVGLAVACADVDGDGDTDVYFANFGADGFYLNSGQGKFRNATADAGFASEEWSCSAAFFDAERDGFLDLYLVNYVQHDEERICHDLSTRREYCGPLEYTPAADALYRNQGDGNFVDVSAEAGIDRPASGLGVVCLDFDSDGWTDVYVANDAMANHLWLNQHDGRFVDEAHERGAGVNRHGKPEGSMGVTAGDPDNDGSLDLFMTHIVGENNTLYLGSRASAWRDRSVQSRLASFDRPFTGFGCAFADFDQDGWLDLAVVNGRVKRGPVYDNANLGPFWNEYAEPNQLFRNAQGATFEDLSDRSGAFGTQADIGRGLAVGDLDGDGDLDLVTSAFAGTPRIYHNVAARGHWLRVRTLTGKVDALGATVRLIAGERSWLRVNLAAYSYGSSSEAIAHFGLGELDHYDALEVRWPDGKIEGFAGGKADRQITLVEGSGERQ